MQRNLFIQFYYKLTREYGNKYVLGNGFSHTYDYCKSIGDFLWLDYKDKEKDYFNKLPIQTGNVYISCIEIDHLKTSLLLATHNPQLNFILGGPACVIPFQIIKTIPKNVTITTKRVEEWFGFENYKYEWNIELPNKIKHNDELHITYSLDNNYCYWRKCIFCMETISEKKSFVHNNPQFEFKNIRHAGRKNIRLSTSSINRKHLKYLVNLPEQFHYILYMRCGPEELNMLKEMNVNDLKKLKKLHLITGAEFPTNRMWSYMNKGYDEESFIEFLFWVRRNTMSTSIILGWPNLTMKDANELKRVMYRIPRDMKINYTIRNLTAFYGSSIHDMYEQREKIIDGHFYIGFKPYLTKKAIEANNKAKDVILEYCDKFNKKCYISPY